MQHTHNTFSQHLIRLIKEWTLMISIALGTLGYYAFKHIDLLSPIRHDALVVTHDMMPALIFTMLFITFCKVDIRQYCFKRWYLGAIAVQLALVMALILPVRLLEDSDFRFVLEGCIICIIAPSATASAVIVKKLGGNVPSITTFTLIAGFVTAVCVPIILPLLPAKDLQMSSSMDFIELFSTLLGRVFPLLICPFIATLILRLVWPKANMLVATRSKDVAFYLWAVALVINVAQTIHSIETCGIDFYHIVMIALGSLAACVLQFGIGQKMGEICDDQTACRQGMGQKNTAISIWIGLTYLNPITAVGPGSYVLWQNIINSVELVKQDKRNEREGQANNPAH